MCPEGEREAAGTVDLFSFVSAFSKSEGKEPRGKQDKTSQRRINRKNKKGKRK
jgi:hypothetical protein